jgi:hypothetical protein
MIAKCEFCGKMNCIAHTKYVDRCEECGKRYAKYSSYKSLQKSSPTDKRARLLDKIVDEYSDLRRLGYKVPRDLQEKTWSY